MVRAGCEHDQPVEAEGDAGALRQPVFQSRQEIVVDRIGLAVERLLLCLVGGEAATLLGGIGQFAEGIRQFEPADVQLEALPRRGSSGFRRDSAAIETG